MKRRGTGAALCALALALMACNGPKSHGILTFFFDGVPPPEAQDAAGRGATQAGAPAAAPVIRVSEHGPYAAKLCSGCHDTARGNALVVPGDQLCSRCHTLALSKKFIHGPLMAGGCLLCHDPHRSRYPYLLVAESAAFCIRCHDPKSLRRVDGHEGTGPSCTTCHEAHMSDREYLLR